MSNGELNHILKCLQESKAKTVEDGLNVLDGYFSTVTWSLLKDEWTKHMTLKMKKDFVSKALKLK